ncbi:proline rich protein 5MeD [Colletotrichum cereale]|nr:proline rich protein 5MeD [Colletotrichum cereale]
MGYNAREDYIYGVSQSSNTPYNFKVIRILSNGSTQDVASITKFSTTATSLFNSGDIDENGQYWISTGGNDFYQYNLNPGTAGYGTLVNSSLLAGTGGYIIGDWTVVPGAGGGDLWSVGVKNFSAFLLRWSRTTHVFTVVRELGNLTNAPTTSGSAAPFWGASYATADGYLFAFENNSGQVWRISVTGAVANQKVADAPVSSQNDGARCLDSANVVVSGG